jgi:NADP-dependent 3-hydroxy acid dehydrogenase YdfG
MNQPLIIVTGASSGIGEAIAKVFSKAGFPVALLARSLKAMEALGLPNALCIETDVTDINSVRKAIAQAEEKFGPVDCLINNAGYAKGGDFLDISHDDRKKTMEVNVLGVINGIESVLPGMRKRKAGTIINITSLADRHARPHVTSYAASKAAVKSLTESLRMGNAQYGIRISMIAPAKISTPMVMQGSGSNDHLIAVEEMAGIVLWVYQQPKSICIRDMVVAPTSYEP